jgi:hypothetical protein
VFVANEGESSLRRHVARLAGLCGVLACTLLPACSSVSHVVADSWPRMLGGLPEGVPPRSETPPAFMPIQEAAPVRDTKPMTAAERQKIEAEINVQRGQNTTQAEQVKNESPSRLPPIH